MRTAILAVSALSASIWGVEGVRAMPDVAARIALAPASYMGVGVIELSDETAREIGLVEPHGVEISSVAEDSPAAVAGLRKGDIVLSYRGERVNGYQHFARLVRETPAGRAVELGIVRDGQRRTVDVEIGSRGPDEAVRRTLGATKQHLDAVKERLEGMRLNGGALVLDLNFPRVRMNVRNRRIGAELENLDGQLAEFFGVDRGVLVREVRDGSAADEAGLRAGDVIVAVSGREVRSVDQAGRALARSDSEPLTVEIVRNRERTSLRLDTDPPSSLAPARPVSSLR